MMKREKRRSRRRKRFEVVRFFCLATLFLLCFEVKTLSWKKTKKNILLSSDPLFVSAIPVVVVVVLRFPV